MPGQILINIVRPQAGVSYRSEIAEAEPADELAACQLAFATLAHHMRRLYGVAITQSWEQSPSRR